MEGLSLHSIVLLAQLLLEEFIEQLRTLLRAGRAKASPQCPLPLALTTARPDRGRRDL